MYMYDLSSVDVARPCRGNGSNKKQGSVKASFTVNIAEVH